jgi:cytochrome c553
MHTRYKSMKHILIILTLTMSALQLFAAQAAAPSPDAPRQTWIALKCALCHGTDGTGNTAQGRSKHVPDLRSERFQKLSDAMLAKTIAERLSVMHSFTLRLTKEQMNLIIVYIHRLAHTDAKKP